MYALAWKKYIGIKKNKAKSIVFFISPIIYFVFLYMYGIRYDIIASFFPLAFTLFSSLIYWNVEDLVYSEALLVTQLDTKRSWRLNYLLVSVLGNVYSYVIIFAGTCVLNFITNNNYHFSALLFMQALCDIFLSMAIIGMGTLQNSDFSKLKQLYSSVFSILNIVVPVALVVIGNSVHLTTKVIVIEFLVSFVLIAIGEFIIKMASNEKLIENTQKLVDGYMNSIIND